MPRQISIQQKSSPSIAVVKVTWRFFTGAHLNGKTYNDATWWLDSSPMFRRKRSAYTWWRRKARMKRAAWRHAIFWPVVLVMAGVIWSLSSTLVIIGAMLPAIIFFAFKRIRFALFLPVVANDSDDGATQYWVLKPKYRRAIERIRRPADKRRRPGLASRSELERKPRLRDIPQSVKNAVALEVTPELDGQPPTQLKLLMMPDDKEP